MGISSEIGRTEDTKGYSSSGLNVQNCNNESLKQRHSEPLVECIVLVGYAGVKQIDICFELK